ncbi:dipeptidyl aminopeptidase, synthesized as a glycosylated precursor [Nadsonia fulvescens var. elongata DSM 6958]|uniref:Dipeptidyl aminopeptidase, synthesized as a glycosylated n=1 Tax=Nadsonia fulvescens var. elongata DSM 6958 TaxID=857566 RepID=A0A1E3PHU6_9ASCO|nr:dipeptidyl aminopeptidase, synthesized as a glycosylated precursor [Nadsonia fulvescens var. elongata DSM 6958]
MTVLRSGKLVPRRQSVAWITTDEADKGSYLIHDEQGYRVLRWSDAEYEYLLTHSQEIVYMNQTFKIDDVLTKPDLQKSIIQTSTVKNWRHSSTAQFWVLDTLTQKVEPVFSENPKAMLSFALWSPRGDRIAFVYENNLYIRYVDSPGKVVQITFDGGADIFYGRPDWVYEEEVFSGATALWWSANGDFLAFLRTNDSAVSEFTIPYFVKDSNLKEAYPELVDIKYPKPGYSNPTVDILFLDLANEEYFGIDSQDNDSRLSLITEVLWTGNDTVVIRRTNRESDLLQIDLVNTQSREHTVVRTEDLTKESSEDNDGGWFEITQDTTYVPANPAQGIVQDGYIDTVVVDGYNHLAYFSPLNASVPKKVLTMGIWEVDSAPAAYDSETGLVYFLATTKSSVERHLYSVDLNGEGFRNITDISVDGYYQASFSAGARYALLSYNGPEVPYQVMVDLHLQDPLGNSHSVESNEELTKTLEEYHLPSVHHSQVDLSTGVKVNTVEIRPPHFDETRKQKYPVLFYVYGGPNSQTVTKRFSYDFQKTVAAVADAIVVSVDGRGTGFMGREFRAFVHDQLGILEAQDQIAAAQLWASKSYVDADRLAIWGWSYGGYLTLKTLETDAGNTFQYGMAVAPVTDWRFYDSIYTERYMHTPVDNPKGYEASRIHDMDRLANCTRFLVMHGTGDDNVHFQNTLSLLDDLDLASVENFDVHIFPDSDHSISHHNAYAMVYDRLLTWIQHAFNGQFLL